MIIESSYKKNSLGVKIFYIILFAFGCKQLKDEPKKKEVKNRLKESRFKGHLYIFVDSIDKRFGQEI